MLPSYSEISKKILEAHMKELKTVVLLPVGCTEQHGPFLTIETDTIIAEAFTRDLVALIDNGGWVGIPYPPIQYSPTRSNKNFCGTVSISEKIFRAYIEDICMSLLCSSFDSIAIICGHGPAEPSLIEICFKLVNNQFQDSVAPVKPMTVLSLFDNQEGIEKKFNQKPGKHADWREFLMLYHVLGPKHFDKITIDSMKSFREKCDFEIHKSSVPGIPLEFRSAQGVIGDPLPYSDGNWKTLAEEMWNMQLEFLSRKFVSDMEEFISMIDQGSHEVR